MAVSKWKDIRLFEFEQKFLPDTYIVIRLSMFNYHDFISSHSLDFPYDNKLFRLFQACGREVSQNLDDISCFLANDEEISFIFKRQATCHNRRRDKLVSTVSSLFSSAFTFFWKKFFNSILLQSPPMFLGKGMTIPNRRILRNYLISRQENMYQSALQRYCQIVLQRISKDKNECLSMNVSEKNELLFSHGINFNSLPAHHRHGIFTYFLKKSFHETSDYFQIDKFWANLKKNVFVNALS